jgi:hypothetical protein
LTKFPSDFNDGGATLFALVHRPKRVDKEGDEPRISLDDALSVIEMLSINRWMDDIEQNKNFWRDMKQQIYCRNPAETLCQEKMY